MRDFLESNFGIEVEMTGITRNTAAKIVARYLGGRIERDYDYYDTYRVIAPDGRTWKFVSDSSIQTQKKQDGRKVSAGKTYSVELVSPILTYRNDIADLQEIIRKLRRAGAFAEKQNKTGIHIHLDGADHTPRSLRNFVNIIYSRNDLLYESLEVEANRAHYCKKMDAELVAKMKRKKPKTFNQIENIWYEGYRGNRSRHYHQSRYHFLNLHSFFNGVGTVELRGFNSSRLHAGKIRAFIVLSLALNNQALTQKFVSSKKVQAENPKFSMRTWLNRIGFIGDEFKNCRAHLIKHLPGSAAWRFRETA